MQFAGGCNLCPAIYSLSSHLNYRVSRVGLLEILKDNLVDSILLFDRENALRGQGRYQSVEQRRRSKGAASSFVIPINHIVPFRLCGNVFPVASPTDR